jgi:hypothetical protein
VPIEPEPVVRDLDLVLVTGAGASTGFGSADRPLPLMKDWAEALFEKISKTDLNLLELMGLSHQMPGDVFEAQLGAFLRRVPAFTSIRELIAPSIKMPGIPQSARSTGVVDGWYDGVAQDLNRAVELVAESLYEQFAARDRNLAKAAECYESLLQTFTLRPGKSRIVYATTNYDDIGEHSLARCGWLPDWGEAPPVGAETLQDALSVDTIMLGIPRYVPVLHLHGRIGWYRRTDGTIQAVRTDKHSSGNGDPVVVYPDPQKSYDSNAVIAALWSHFDDALWRARRVLVLGHSLNDELLVRRLAERVQPLQLLGICVLGQRGNPDSIDPSAQPLADKVRDRLVGASIIPIRFGMEDANSGKSGILEWLDRTTERVISPTAT